MRTDLTRYAPRHAGARAGERRARVLRRPRRRRRLHSAEPNWLDDGGFTLGIASFAIVDGDEALVYDTHLTSPMPRDPGGARARAPRLRVLLSHWHLDHVAGNEAFADCEIIAHAWTLEELASRRAAIEDGDARGPAGDQPAGAPADDVRGRARAGGGRIRLTVRHLQIHSRDAAVVLLDGGDLVLAGDTLEDTITYVSEPRRDRAPPGRAGSDALLGRDAVPAVPRRPRPDRGRRLRANAGRRHLPLHRRLLAARDDAAAAALDLREFVRPELDAGWITYLPAYEAVHRENLAAVGADVKTGSDPVVTSRGARAAPGSRRARPDPRSWRACFHSSPSAILRIVPRSTLPERVLGSARTTRACLNDATGPIRSRTAPPARRRSRPRRGRRPP